MVLESRLEWYTRKMRAAMSDMHVGKTDGPLLDHDTFGAYRFEYGGHPQR